MLSLCIYFVELEKKSVCTEKCKKNEKNERCWKLNQLYSSIWTDKPRRMCHSCTTCIAIYFLLALPFFGIYFGSCQFFPEIVVVVIGSVCHQFQLFALLLPVEVKVLRLVACLKAMKQEQSTKSMA